MQSPFRRIVVSTYSKQDIISFGDTEHNYLKCAIIKVEINNKLNNTKKWLKSTTSISKLAIWRILRLAIARHSSIWSLYVRIRSKLPLKPKTYCSLILLSKSKSTNLWIGLKFGTTSRSQELAIFSSKANWNPRNIHMSSRSPTSSFRFNWPRMKNLGKLRLKWGKRASQEILPSIATKKLRVSDQDEDAMIFFLPDIFPISEDYFTQKH